MSMFEEKTVSLWAAEQRPNVRAAAAFSASYLHAEIVVIGAGISGLSCAYALARRGREVVVIDAGDIGQGNTFRTTAHLSNVIDDRFATLKRERGSDIARIAAASHAAAIDFIEQVQREEGIDCAFKRLDGYLILGQGDRESTLDKERKAAVDAGLEVEQLASPPAGIPQAPCLRFPNQARFNPRAYLEGLAGAIGQKGGRIFSGALVTSVEDGEPVRIEIAGDKQVTADVVIVATATPINDRVKLHTKLSPYRTYAIAARAEDAGIPDALIWDTEDPYHYVRLAEANGSTYAILGGADHKTGQAEDETECLRSLTAWAQSRFAIGQVEYRWSGQVMETIDGLGLIGLNPGDKHVYIVAGDSGMGMTHGTISAMLLPTLIENGDHPWKDAYDPARKPIGAAATFVSENVNVAAQFVDYVRGSDVSELKDIPTGEGAVLRHGASKIAAFRDDRGRLHVRSAVCPHLGCIVHWNRLEKVWDCPCHGSQFAGTGHVLHGPATAPLETVEEFNNQNNPNIAEGG